MAAANSAAPAPFKLSRESKLIVFVAVLASLLEIVDGSIVNVALTTMMGNLGATLEDISMVVTGYAIANAIVLPLSAWLGERLGRRTYYIGCILLFTASSVACGLAPNLTALVLCRILQGFAGGALLPTSQTLIYEQFPKEKAGIAGAVFGMSVMIGPTLGPTLGGYLTDNFGWRSIFNVNLPLGLFAALLGGLVIKNVDHGPRDSRAGTQAAAKDGIPDDGSAPSHAQPKSKIDAVGLGLLAIGIGCLQFCLERGQADDWFDSRTILFCAIGAVIALPFFIWWELKVEDPIVNVRLFTDNVVRNGVLLMSSIGFVLYAIVFVLPVFAQRSLHYDATQVGMLFIPGSLVTAFMMPFVGRAMQKVDSRILIAIGLAAVEAFLLMMSHYNSNTGVSELLRTLYVRGFGMAFLFVPINSSVLSQFKGRALGQVSGMMNLSRQLGGSIGIALVDTLFEKRTAQNYTDMIAHVSALNPWAQSLMHQSQGGLSSRLSGALGLGTPHMAAVAALFGRVEAQAFILSASQLTFTIAMIFLLSFIPLVTLRLRFRTDKPISGH